MYTRLYMEDEATLVYFDHQDRPSIHVHIDVEERSTVILSMI
jgi:hypothetical protein